MDAQPFQRFCLQCGRPITDDFGFCTACGYYYDKAPKVNTGSANVRPETDTVNQTNESRDRQAEADRIAFQNYAIQMQQRVMENQRMFTVAMLAIWVILSFSMAVILLTDVGGLTTNLSNAVGLGKQPSTEAVILLVSGICAVASLACVITKKQFKIAFYACLVSAAVTTAFMAFGIRMGMWFFMFGLLAVLRIRNTRKLFS